MTEKQKQQNSRGGVQVGGVYLPADVAEAFYRRVEQADPPTTIKGVILTALRRYLREEGFLKDGK